MAEQSDNETWGKLLIFLGEEANNRYPHGTKAKIAEMAKLCGQREVEFLIKRTIDAIKAEQKIRAFNEVMQGFKTHFDDLGNLKK